MQHIAELGFALCFTSYPIIHDSLPLPTPFVFKGALNCHFLTSDPAPKFRKFATVPDRSICLDMRA